VGQRIQKRTPENRIEGQLGKFYFRADAGTINEEKRTVDVTWTTGHRGRRDGWFGSYYEELEVSKKAVRMDRLKTGAPVLFGHQSDSLDTLIGSVESAKIDEEAGEGLATLRFDDDPESERVFKKIKSGSLRAVSVGYFVHQYEELEEKQDDLPIYRATDWEPAEISLVPVPFDPEARVRKDDNEQTTCVVIKRGKTMALKVEKKVDEPTATDPIETKPAVTEPVADVRASDPEPAAKAAIPASFLRACEKAKLDPKVIRELGEEIEKGTLSVEQAHERVIDEWAKQDRKVAGPMIEVTTDRMAVMTEGMRNALLHRVDPKTNELDEKGRAFRGLSLVEMGREYLESVGISSKNLTRHEVATKLLSRNTQIKVRGGFQGTSDFTEILANVANKTLRDAYGRAPQTFRPWTRQSFAPDFKTMKRAALGDGPALKKVTEHGEYKHGKFSEKAESYALATYGVIVPFTRQAIINDDLGAFDRVVTALGLNAAGLESDIVYAILTANAAMADGVALFYSTHGNLGTAGPVSETTLSEMRKLGRKQTGPDGQKLNIAYRYLIVPVKQETTAQKAIAQIVAATTSNVNIFAGAYQVIAEPRLDDTSENHWYAAAEPGIVDTIEYAYLEGNESVQFEEEVDFDTDGILMKARHDFGAKAIDHRGLFKNPSAS